MQFLSDRETLGDQIIVGFFISPLMRDWDAELTLEHFQTLPLETVEYYRKHAQQLADIAARVLVGEA